MKQIPLKDIPWKPRDFALVRREHHATRLVRITSIKGGILHDDEGIQWRAATGERLEPLMSGRWASKNQPRIAGLADTKDLQNYGTVEQQAASVTPAASPVKAPVVMPSGLLDGVEVGMKLIARHPDGVSQDIGLYVADLGPGWLADTNDRKWYRSTGAKVDAKPNSPVIVAIDPVHRMAIGAVSEGDRLVIESPDKKRFPFIVLKVEPSKVMDEGGLFWDRITGTLLSKMRGMQGMRAVQVIRKAEPVKPEPVAEKQVIFPTKQDLKILNKLQHVKIGDTILWKGRKSEGVIGVRIESTGLISSFTTDGEGSEPYSVTLETAQKVEMVLRKAKPVEPVEPKPEPVQTQLPLAAPVEAPAVTVEPGLVLPTGARAGDTFIVEERASGGFGLVQATASQVLSKVTLRDFVVTVASWIRGRP